MDPKQKMIFAAVAGVCGLAIAALAVLLFMQIGAMNEAREARDSAESELSSYYSETPYPSKVNREIRVKDAETYTAVSTAARNLLAATLAYPQGESPSQFVTRVVDTIHVLDGRKNASRVELIDSMAKGKTSTAANEAVMDYSFGKYVVQGELPKEADVPRLAKQFAVIEHVCDLLLDAGALDITQVTREMFDTAGEPKEEEASTSRSRKNRRNRKETKAQAPATGVEVAAPLVEDGVTAEQFSVTFRARYTAVAKALNALNTDDLFIVVTDLSFNNASDLRARTAEMVKRRQSARATAARRARNRDAEAATAAPDEPLFANAAPAERLLTDPENAVPLEVTLKFEVYSVPPAETPEAESEAAE